MSRGVCVAMMTASDDEFLRPARPACGQRSAENLTLGFPSTPPVLGTPNAPKNNPHLLPKLVHVDGHADVDGSVQIADVDAEFEGVGAYEAPQLPVRKPPLDLAAILSRVSGAVRLDHARQGLGSAAFLELQ